LFSYFACIFRISSIVFFRQNGPSIWHKRFLRLLCTSKGKKGDFAAFFSSLLYTFFFSSFTDRPIPDASIIRLALIHPRQQRAYSNYIYFLPYVIKYRWPSCMHFFHSENIMRITDTMRRISLSLSHSITLSLFLCSSRHALHKCVHGQQRVYF